MIHHNLLGDSNKTFSEVKQGPIFYYVINTAIPLSQTDFNHYKKLGISENTMDEIRKNLKGDLSIIKSQKEISRYIKHQIVFSGRLSSLEQYIKKHVMEW